jgi:hypothetical protein
MGTLKSAVEFCQADRTTPSIKSAGSEDVLLELLGPLIMFLLIEGNCDDSGDDCVFFCFFVCVVVSAPEG